MMKLQQNPKTGQLFVNIPKQLSLALDYQKGEEIAFKVIDSKTLSIRRIKDL